MNILAVNLLTDIIVSNNCIKEELCDNCKANLKSAVPCSPIIVFVPKYLFDVLHKYCIDVKCKNCLFKTLNGVCNKSDYIGRIIVPKSFDWAENKRW